jgi:hypothetical protein
MTASPLSISRPQNIKIPPILPLNNCSSGSMPDSINFLHFWSPFNEDSLDGNHLAKVKYLFLFPSSTSRVQAEAAPSRYRSHRVHESAVFPTKRLRSIFYTLSKYGVFGEGRVGSDWVVHCISTLICCVHYYVYLYFLPSCLRPLPFLAIPFIRVYLWLLFPWRCLPPFFLSQVFWGWRLIFPPSSFSLI